MNKLTFTFLLAYKNENFYLSGFSLFLKFKLGCWQNIDGFKKRVNNNAYAK